MSNFQLLSPELHKDLRVITEHSVELGDGVRAVQTFPFEFRSVQGHYPIFLQKDAETGQFQCMAMLGFEEGENLFLEAGRWTASYVPLMIKRQPFLIGFQSTAESADKKPVVTIDMDNPRVSKESGEPLFLEHGGQSEFLQESISRLEYIHQAHEHANEFVAHLLELNLIEAFTLEITMEDGSSNQLHGFYTVNEEKVKELSGDQFATMNQRGFLQPLFMMLASHSCVGSLVRLKGLKDKAA